MYNRFFVLAKRTQLRLGAALHKGLFKQNQIQVPEQAESGTCYQFHHPSILPSDIVCESVNVKNTEYKVGMLVVLAVSSQNKITAGWIKKIVVREDQAYFLVLSKTCVRQTLRYFRSTDGESQLEMTKQEELRSYKPLIPRGNEQQFIFFLHGKLIDDPVD
jgi:hypothetical protein